MNDFFLSFYFPSRKFPQKPLPCRRASRNRGDETQPPRPGATYRSFRSYSYTLLVLGKDCRHRLTDRHFVYPEPAQPYNNRLAIGPCLLPLSACENKTPDKQRKMLYRRNGGNDIRLPCSQREYRRVDVVSCYGARLGRLPMHAMRQRTARLGMCRDGRERRRTHTEDRVLRYTVDVYRCRRCGVEK